MTAILLAKLVLAPALVVGSTLAGRRWGAAIAGVLVSLPIVAGPILLFSWLDHGDRFAAEAASASLRGIAVLGGFALLFSVLCAYLPWPVVLGVTWAACLTGGVLMGQVHVGPVGGLLLALSVDAVCWYILSRRRADAPVAVQPRWWDLPSRAVATGLLVVTLTTAASALGPEMTGVLAPFPIATSVVAAFALAQAGPATAVATLAGVLRGLPGFAIFCFVVALLVERLGGPAAFAAGTAAALATAFLLRPRVRGTITSAAPSGSATPSRS
ncbi:hypothetical protein AB0M47_40135 [Hamadaea sp. NPDC051192]|uniref:hypothetical protein n=1 Tax=Hamadaea sp. NPDC051192 TaxID=3154940 RepID=UPI00344AB641